jgi:probable HAF family extracellular repeat protein
MYWYCDAFRWTASGGMVDLGSLPGFGDGYVTGDCAYGVSADGSVIVGYSFYYDEFDSTHLEAFRWTAAGGMVGLGYLHGGDSSSGAECVSPDGSIIVGSSGNDTAREWFLWTQSLGMRSLNSLLGAALPEGWMLREVRAVTVNGDVATLVGYGTNPYGYEEAYIATVPIPEPVRPGGLNCDGAVSFDDINPFVTALVSQAGYEARYSGCRWLNGDINGDGDVNFDDINPFVTCLVAGACP